MLCLKYCRSVNISSRHVKNLSPEVIFGRHWPKNGAKSHPWKCMLIRMYDICTEALCVTCGQAMHKMLICTSSCALYPSAVYVAPRAKHVSNPVATTRNLTTKF